MGVPGNTAPSRPDAVPAAARWEPSHPGYPWALGALDGSRQRHGPYRMWSRDGRLWVDASYEHGILTGNVCNRPGRASRRHRFLQRTHSDLG